MICRLPRRREEKRSSLYSGGSSTCRAIAERSWRSGSRTWGPASPLAAAVLSTVGVCRVLSLHPSLHERREGERGIWSFPNTPHTATPPSVPLLTELSQTCSRQLTRYGTVRSLPTAAAAAPPVSSQLASMICQPTQQPNPTHTATQPTQQRNPTLIAAESVPRNSFGVGV
jgi:hypothetical protein